MSLPKMRHESLQAMNRTLEVVSDTDLALSDMEVAVIGFSVFSASCMRAGFDPDAVFALLRRKSFGALADTFPQFDTAPHTTD